MRRTDKEAPELDITAFLNLMVVLVPFLLITAVFSRITVLQLNLPEDAGASAAADIDETITLEVIVRSDRLQIGDGDKIVLQLMNPTPPEAPVQEYDWGQLNATLAAFKQNLPDKTDAIILMESGVKYDYMIRAMDSVGAVVRKDASGASVVYSLFPDISFGDAPESNS